VDIKVILHQGKMQHKSENYKLRKDEILMHKNRIYVPNDQDLKIPILSEIHKAPYARHLGYQKTMIAIKNQYYWAGMKKEIAKYIARCIECQKVKDENRNPDRLIQPLPIPKWKWEVVTMDFITRLPRTTKQHDSIMVVVDKLTKASHFIPVKLLNKQVDIDEIYM
jgi:hypothetical protein